MTQDRRLLRTSADTRRRLATHVAALEDPDADVAMRAEGRLIRFGRKAVAPLIEAADHPDPRVRFRAVWVLGKIGDARALSTIQRLTEDADGRVAYDAVLSLGELGETEAIPKLWEIALRLNDQRELDSAARSALVKLGALTESSETVDGRT
ncbi:MAG: HEAT repeat domain-containing protein [Actinomycetota bacterium]